MLKVVRLSTSSPHIYQHALLTSELREIFSSMADRQVGVLANQQVRREYARISGEEEVDTETETDASAKRKPLSDDGDCPICFDEMDEEEGLTFCQAACGSNFHAECIRMWSTQMKSSAQVVTCPACIHHTHYTLYTILTIHYTPYSLYTGGDMSRVSPGTVY
jgi:hypothetical protein